MGAVWGIHKHHNVVLDTILHKLEGEMRDVSIEDENTNISAGLVLRKGIKLCLQPVESEFRIGPSIGTRRKPAEKLSEKVGEVTV